MEKSKLLKALACAAGYMGLLFASSSVVVLLFMILKINNDRIVAIFSAAFSTATVFVWLHSRHRDILSSLHIHPVPVKKLVLVIAASVAATALVQCVQFAFPAHMRSGLVGEALTGNLALDVICLVIASPVAEEIYFRGLLIPALSEGMGQRAAIAVSGFLFAVLHEGVAWMLMAFCISLFYSAVFVRTKSLVACTAAHMTSNTLAVIYHLLFV